MNFISYLPCKECDNSETWGMICVKCGKCGRKFEDGVLVNVDEFPGYDPDSEEEEFRPTE